MKKCVIENTLQIKSEFLIATVKLKIEEIDFIFTLQKVYSLIDETFSYENFKLPVYSFEDVFKSAILLMNFQLI